MEVDLEFRPATYWPWLPGEAQVLARIKGVARREAAREVLASGGPAALDPTLFEESLNEEERRAAGRVHPFFMGGEYLPDLHEDEVEIARIQLASTMRDVVSIRARQSRGAIKYSVVDEYETTFSFRPASSEEPLTLRGLISLIESVEVADQPGVAYPKGPRLPAAFRELVGEEDLEAAARFVTVSSEIYPELEDYYEAHAEAWLRQACANWDVDDDASW